MRPLKLEMEGFTAFRQHTELDFSELDLFAITGPTGAGKSSIIDAICFALYGRVPRITAETGSLISQGLERMQVALVFEASGRRYRVLRETRRKGASSARLETESHGTWQPISDRARDMTQRVEQIVGLDYEAFIRSVLLPQGQFQEFLAGSPERRRDVMRRLLRLEVYERMQTRAGDEARTLQASISDRERRLREELTDATPEARLEKQAQLTQALSEAAKLAQQLKALDEGISLARDLVAARQELARLEAERQQLADKLETTRALVEHGDETLASLRQELDGIARRLEDNAFDVELLVALTGAARTAGQLERVEAENRQASANIASFEKAVLAAEESAKANAVAWEAARIASQRAQDMLEEQRRHNLAAALQAGLKPGDACPVCGGIVGEIAAAAPAELGQAEAAVAEARRRESALANQASAAESAVAVAKTRLASTEEQLQQREAQAQSLATELSQSLPGLDDRSAATIKMALEIQGHAQQELTVLRSQESNLAAELQRQKQALSAAIAGVEGLETDIEGTETKLAAAMSTTRLVSAQLDQAASQHGWQLPDADPMQHLETARQAAVMRQETLQREIGRLETQLEHLEQQIALAATLREEASIYQTQYDIANDLALMLRADRFQAFVQAEALRTLAEDGSRKLMQLSDRRYELGITENGQDFEVQDHWNADERRSVRTLSGGETFLASLALALALAESLPGLSPGGRLTLDSIFLDEGFGSLDPEALDRAADALDALRMENRLVCVITHLHELAERLPAQVVVSKSETGSSISVL